MACAQLLQDAWEVLAYYQNTICVDGSDTAVVAAQSFWDYAQNTDRALPGVGLNCNACASAPWMRSERCQTVMYTLWNLQIGEAYKATGRCFSVAAGRISFSYGLKGWTVIVAATFCRAADRRGSVNSASPPTHLPKCRPSAYSGHSLQQQLEWDTLASAHAAGGAQQAGPGHCR